MAFHLSIQAQDDLIGIIEASARFFGNAQATRYSGELFALFDVIADNPKLARERREITPPVRVHPFKAHLIVYIVDDLGDVLILRVRHGHENWSSPAE